MTSPINFADRSRPFCTTDAVIFVGLSKIVLIERAKAPLGFALPGGHVEYGESLVECCVREVKEETGLILNPADCWQFYTYSLPDRDPRSHTMSTVYVTMLMNDQEPKAGDDAAKVHIVSLEECLKPEFVFAFDHKQIVQDVVNYTNGLPRRIRGA